MYLDGVNCFSGVTVSVLASRAVDGGFEFLSDQTKDYIISICASKEKKQILVCSELR
jgi:hypothetical protein